MALRVWLPLNGNLENKGASEINVVSGSPSYKAGKISLQSLNLNNRITFDCPKLANLQTLSICFWGMAEESSTLTSNWQDLLGFTDVSSSGTNGTFRWETTYASTNGIHWHDNATNAFVNGSHTHIAQKGVWCHCCVVFDYEKGKIFTYTNGILVNTHNHLGGKFNSNGRFYLGETNNIEGRINDVRIYDHALSALEVKEISQGLILHYKLDGFSGGSGRNIALKSNNGHFGSTNDLETITFSGWDNYAQYNLNLTEAEWNNLVGQKVTYTCYINNIEQTAGTGTGIMIHFRYADGTYTQYGGGKNGVSGSYFAQGESGIARLTVTVPDPTTRTNPTTIAYVQYSVRHNSSSGAGTVQYQHAQVEIGDTPTAWNYAPEDLNINTTKIIDSSGYGNDGIAVNSPSDAADSKSRYGICTEFNGSNTYINAGTGAKVKDEITIAWWGYMNTWSSYARAISCTEGGGWNFEPSSGKLNFAMGTGATSNTYKSCTSNTTLASLSSGWHHFVGTYDGLDSKLYIDGVLDKTLNCYTTKTPIYYHPANSIIVGAEANANNTAAGNYFNGKLSDIRIYAAALSAEDIKKLYQTPTEIDKNGSWHTHEFYENGENFITKTGLIKNSASSEYPFTQHLKYDPEIYFEPDGSVWIHIYHHNNPGAGSFASNNTFANSCYIDENRWFNATEICNQFNKWEFLIKYAFTSGGVEYKERWIQTKNPEDAVFADVDAADITRITGNGYKTGTWGGLYKKNSSAYWVLNNGNSGNWWGATGSFSIYQSGIPGYGGTVTTTGYNDLYIRIDNIDFDQVDKAWITKSNIYLGNILIEK